MKTPSQIIIGLYGNPTTPDRVSKPKAESRAVWGFRLQEFRASGKDLFSSAKSLMSGKGFRV